MTILFNYPNKKTDKINLINMTLVTFDYMCKINEFRTSVFVTIEDFLSLKLTLYYYQKIYVYFFTD
jgi:hypothetical protein